MILLHILISTLALFCSISGFYFDTSGFYFWILLRFTSEKDKASFLLDHLEGAAKTEVKFQVDIKKATADEMVTVLREVYGSHDTWIQQQFYSRD